VRCGVPPEHVKGIAKALAGTVQMRICCAAPFIDAICACGFIPFHVTLTNFCI
jgi:hypothetical protein